MTAWSFAHPWLARVALALAIYVLSGALLARSPLGALNFLLLQWFGIRLGFGWASSPPTGSMRTTPHGRWWSADAPPRDIDVAWLIDRWVWPLTGWWSAYRYIHRP